MKTLIIGFILCATFSMNLIAQSNYIEAIERGDVAFAKEDFQKALEYYFAAEAFDETKKVEVQRKISDVLLKVDAIKNQAIENRKKAEKSEQSANDSLKVAREAKDTADARLERAEIDKDTASARLERVKIAKAKADSLKQLAERELKIANRIKNIAAARIKANEAMRQLAGRDLENGTHTAIAAYDSNKIAKGPLYNKDCYQALDLAYKSYLKENNKNPSPIYELQKEAIRCISTAYRDGKELIAFGMDNRRLILIKDGKKLQEDIILPDRPRSIAFSHDGKFLLVGTFSGELIYYEHPFDKATKKELKLNEANFKGAIQYIEVIEPSPGNFFLAFASAERVYVGALHHIKNEFRFDVKGNFEIKKIKAFAFSPDSKYLLAGNDEAYQIFKLKNNIYIKNISVDIPKGNNTPTSASIGIDSLGRYLLAVGFENGEVKLSYLNNIQKCLNEEKGCITQLSLEHNVTISKILFNRDASQMVTASHDHTAKLWNLKSIMEKKTEENNLITEDVIPLVGHKLWIWDMAYSHDKTKLYTVSEDRSVVEWFADIEKLYEKIKYSPKEE